MLANVEVDDTGEVGAGPKPPPPPPGMYGWRTESPLEPADRPIMDPSAAGAFVGLVVRGAGKCSRPGFRTVRRCSRRDSNSSL